MNEPIKVGYQTYIYDGGEEFGAVREVSPDGSQLVVYIENAGEFVVPLDAATETSTAIDTAARLAALGHEAVVAPVRRFA